MTSISSYPYGSTSLATYGTAATTAAEKQAEKKLAEAAAASATGSAAVNVTLSEAAKAALAAQVEPPPIASVATAARAAIDKLLAAANTKSALIEGRATIDLGGMDRRSLFAVAANAGGSFTADEQTLAGATATFQFEDAMSGPVAASRITGDYANIYKAALAWLDKAGPEERATTKWAANREAVAKGLQQATANPGVAPASIPGDPVASYMARVADGAPTNAPRDIVKVAADIRAALDAQQAAGGDTIDFKAFDDRSLAALALNKGGLFSDEEVRAAQLEIRDRNSATMTQTYGSNIAAGSAGTLGRDLIARYASMSAEEREAQGWTPELYDKLVANYRTSQQLAQMGGGTGGLYGLVSGGSSGGAPSLVDYMS